MTSRKTPMAAAAPAPRSPAGPVRPDGVVAVAAAPRFSAKLALQRAWVAAPTD